MTSTTPRTAPVTVRNTRAEDVAETVRLRAASWRAAYAGIVPAAYLDGIDTGPEMIERNVRYLGESPAGWHQLVAEREGRVVAFVMCGPERPTPEGARGGVRRGEVYSLYAHPDAWSIGAGMLLLAAARQRLAADGFTQCVVGVLEDNARGRAFYERQGLRPTGESTEIVIGGKALPELLYGGPTTPSRREG
jgi:ribosomal protein S18 acetylase RimI-like enzyme